MKWAAGVAQIAMLIKDSDYKGTSNYGEVRDSLKAISDNDFRDEFVYLVSRLMSLSADN